MKNHLSRKIDLLTDLIGWACIFLLAFALLIGGALFVFHLIGKLLGAT